MHQTTTHLDFRGDARAALGFYGSVFGVGAAANGVRVMGYDIPGQTGGSIGAA